ncbi:MAG: UDP-N-acetylmuramoyl-tripeptide--D-alanyl-D-alanine ligase [Lachnospiraceae bacterium]|nr:UDP-N-acetylmuramoyl-tripeptide--D-alanyl-D-alanine ligase [Lachnospiraceae bacterium]
MKEISVKEAAEAVGGKLCNGGDSAMINGVTMDSRLVKAGNLFVAIKGERVDGHDFIGQVFEKKASAVLCERVPEGVTGPCIVVENTLKALQTLAAYYRKLLDVRVVGVTGSVGKTSTKEIIAAVLSAKFSVLKTAGNYNNEIGLPLTVLSIEPSHEIAVLEMGISDFGEMRLLTSIACPDYCVITNIGQSHLENLGTRDGIYRAKSEIFESMNPEGAIFLNGDDDILCTKKEISGIKPVFFGFGDKNDYRPDNIVPLGLKGTEFDVVSPHGAFPVKTGLFGSHMVGNALAAAAVGHTLGMTDAEITEGLKDASTIAGRLNLIPFGDGFIIDDCYNAAPSSMKAAIDTLALASGRRVAVLGDMFELGTDSDNMHAEIGEYAADSTIEKLICIGENSRHMVEGARNANTGVQIHYFPTVDSFLAEKDYLIAKGDNVLVKASHGMNFVRIVEALKA